MGLQLLTPVSLRFPEAETPQIQIESWSNAARLLHIRGFTRDGLISFEHTTNNDRSRKAETFNLSDWPIFLTVYPDTSPVRRGECYVRLTLLAAGATVGRLSAAYLTDSKTITWPPGVFEGFTEGPGLPRLVAGNDPAAGSEVSVTVPTNARWRLKAIRMELATDATSVNRRVILIIDDGTNTIATIVVEATQGASVTYRYNFYSGAPQETSFTVSQIEVPIPRDLVLFQGWRIRTSTQSLQAGDNWSAPLVQVEEWIEE